MIRTGLDRLLADSQALAGRRYGLLAHGASLTHDLVPAHLALARRGAAPPARLFGPEHGYFGVEQDMVAAADQVDPWTEAPIRSLYGDRVDSLRPAASAFEDLDLLLVDLQDVGSRYYTYAATAVWAAAAAIAAGCEAWILDRPNPLGGLQVEGNLRRPGFESFVGAFPHPVRHGLTVGELARLELSRQGVTDGLRIWPVEGWSRDRHWPHIGRPWIAPSPNMPTYETALVYPGMCLIEGTTLSEGRGTTRPFQLFGAPGLDSLSLARRLEERQLPGVAFVPAFFRPQFQKHAGAVCAGLRVVVLEPAAFQPLRTGVEIVAAVWDLYGGEGVWRHATYEFVDDRLAIDLLAGCDTLRCALEAGEGLDEWVASWRVDEAAFGELCREGLLYSRDS